MVFLGTPTPFVCDHMVISDVSDELLTVVLVNLTGWKLALFDNRLQIKVGWDNFKICFLEAEKGDKIQILLR